MFDPELLLEEWQTPYKTALSSLLEEPRHRYRLYKEDNKYVAEIEAPGFTKSDFLIEWERSKLSISGKRQTTESSGRKYFVDNLSSGDINLSITGIDDDIDKSATHANYNNGILYVVMPIKEDAYKTIKVE